MQILISQSGTRLRIHISAKLPGGEGGALCLVAWHEELALLTPFSVPRLPQAIGRWKSPLGPPQRESGRSNKA